MSLSLIFKSFVPLLVLVLVSNNGFTQSRDLKHIQNDAETAYYSKNYRVALELYQRLCIRDPENGYTNFMVGLCQIESGLSYEEALIHLRKAVKKVKGVDTLVYVQYNLGWAYQLNGHFNMAISNYERVLSSSTEDEELKINSEKGIKQCNIAKELMKVEVHCEVRNMGQNINTEFSDYAPVIPSDESYFAYTSRREDGTGDFLDNYHRAFEDIYLSKPSSKGGFQPSLNVSFPVNTEFHERSVGCSSDGQRMLIYRNYEQKEGGALFMSFQYAMKWGSPVLLDKNINSGGETNYGCLSPDGKYLYFSSNRKGGYGGYDIWKSKLQGDNTWGKAINLGAKINSEGDEIAPFLHADDKTLYFSSNGLNTIGGYDIFKVTKDASGYGYPQNMGMPVNSCGDDKEFILSADGVHGYFASTRVGGYGEDDIYQTVFPEPAVALTMVRGKILTADGTPVNVKIEVFDKENNDRMKYVYSPNKTTGNYLLIIPPGKNYDLLVKAEGYHKYLFNIHIPNQTFFYELNQTIYLSTVKMFGDTIGQGVSLFSELEEKASFNAQQTKDDDYLLDLISQIIEQTDTLAMSGLYMVDDQKDNTKNIPKNAEKNYDALIDLVETVFITTDTSALSYIDKIAEKGFFEDAEQHIMFYDEDHEVELMAVNIGSDLLYVVPPTIQEAIKAANADTVLAGSKSDHIVVAIKQQASNALTQEKEASIKDIVHYTFEFPTNGFDVHAAYEDKLREIVVVMQKHKHLKINIEGHTDQLGSEEENKALSEQRALAIGNWLISKGIHSSRISIYDFGESKPIESNATEEGRLKNRRVEIEIYSEK